MTTSNSIRKNIVIGAVLAATGLTASLAQAQFKVEYKDSPATPKAESVEKTERRVIGITSDDGDHSYEVKLVNGVVTVAKLDGKELDHDRVQVKNDTVLFLNADGKVLHEIKLPGVASLQAPKPIQGMTWLSNDDHASHEFVVATVQPKVMLGINLSEPSDAMRKQLKLGSDKKVILVEKVIDGLPAQKAGIEDFDVILSIDGSDQADGALLTKVLREKNPGDQLKLIVLRGGEKVKVSATLSAYNAKKLGANQSVTITRSGEDLDFPAAPPAPRGGQWLGADVLPQIHEQLTQALNSAGLTQEEIAKVHEQLQSEMGQIRSRFFSGGADGSFEFEFSPDDEQNQRVIEIERLHDAHGLHEAHEAHESHDGHDQHEAHSSSEHHEISKHLELAEMAKSKARQAMRDAERQIMEMRDGRLIVRSAERAQDQVGALEDRLAALESRLETQMDQFESQMERMAEMLERMLDRLESRLD